MRGLQRTCFAAFSLLLFPPFLVLLFIQQTFVEPLSCVGHCPGFWKTCPRVAPRVVGETVTTLRSLGVRGSKKLTGSLCRLNGVRPGGWLREMSEFTEG